MKSIKMIEKSELKIKMQINFELTYIYWTIPGFGQSIEPAIDCQMMD